MHVTISCALKNLKCLNVDFGELNRYVYPTHNFFLIPCLWHKINILYTRWCEILNKCSFDLMALVIKETTKQLESTRLDSKKMEIQLGEMVTKSKLTEFKKDLERQRAELSKGIRATKCTKFARDNGDYQHGKVYFWKDGKLILKTKTKTKDGV